VFGQGVVRPTRARPRPPTPRPWPTRRRTGAPRPAAKT
jgi:hypothetical protein